MEKKRAKSVPNAKKSPGISPAKYRRYWNAKVDPRSCRRFTHAPSLSDWLIIQTLKQTQLDSLASLHRCALCLASCGSSDGRRFITAESRLKHIRLHLSLEILEEPDESKLGALAKKAFPNVPQSRQEGSDDVHEPETLGKPKQRRSGKRKSPTACTCPNCEEAFGGRQDETRQRKVQANGGKVLKGPNNRQLHLCHFDGCGKTFGYTVNLLVHLRIHTGEKPFTCDFDGCNKSFSIAGNLTKHRQTHSGEKPFCCNFDGCEQRFATKFSLIVHRRRTHTGERPFLCKFDGCGKRFSVSGDLKIHHRSHTGEKPYSCDFDGCGKRFINSGQLTNHRRTHSGKKPFFCEFDGCGKRFSVSGNLVTHRRIHSGEMPFICNFTSCGKKFGRTEHLQNHLRTHTGEKPFTCDFDGCAKSFSQFSNLSTHCRTHTGEKPYICDACGKGLAHRSTLNKHRKTHSAVTAKPGKVGQARPSGKLSQSVSHGQPSKPPPLKKARFSKEKNRTTVACADCALPFPNWTLVDYHRQYAHRPAITPGKLVCYQTAGEICIKRGTNLWVAGRQAKNLQACEQCPGRKIGAGWKVNEYDTQADLDRHHKECVAKHPVLCDKCPHRFASKGGLCSHHLATHEYFLPDH